LSKVNSEEVFMEFQRDYDVVVAGAGVAGVAAALACARAGLNTALVEKTVMTGGLATTGLINMYLPLCDGNGHQVIYGIAEELLYLSIKYGPGDVPSGWANPAYGEAAAPGTFRAQRYATHFSPASFTLALDEILVSAGVALWLDTLVCATVMEGRRLTGIEVENKSGRGLLRARCTIDATGDADVAYRAGAPCVTGDNWLSLWALQTSLARARQAVDHPDTASLLEMVRVGGNADGGGHPEGHRTYSGTNGQEVSDFLLEGRRLLREHYQARYAAGDDVDRRRLFPVTLPAMAQFRTTRRIEGLATMASDSPHSHVETSVAVVPDWRKSGPVWEVPYGALVPAGVEGLLAAGRCIAADREAWEVTRVIPPAALTGEVAGIAAVLAVKQDTTPDKLSIADVQRAVRAKHLPLHTVDVIAHV
jgi:hypothetical protein